jgi:hypothetical protein
LDLPLGLCRNGVYRITVEFTQAMNPGALPEKSWQCSIPVRALPGRVMKLKFAGRVLEVQRSGAPEQPYVNVSASDPRGDHRFRVFVRPAVLLPGVHDGIPKGTLLFGRPVPSSLKQLDLTVDEYRSHYLTWTVQPTVATGRRRSGPGARG